MKNEGAWPGVRTGVVGMLCKNLFTIIFGAAKPIRTGSYYIYNNTPNRGAAPKDTTMKNIVKINDNEYRDMVKAGAVELMARNTHIASYPCEDMKSVNRYRTMCFFERSVVDGKYVKGALLGSCVEQELNVSGIFMKPAEARAIKSTGAYNADVDDNRYFACTKDDVVYFVGNRGDITNVKVEG